jgi:glucosyl-dolichyl phosphate glucuronosyltransferase
MGTTLAIAPDVSVIVATYNRCKILRGTLQSLMNQESAGVQYEVIVVDNNSTDDTRKTVEEFSRSFPLNKLVYCVESQQGVSYARNKGIRNAHAPILAFTDDDIKPAANWVAAIHEGFARAPDVDCIGGKVLPESETIFPDWLTRDYWSPLALLDLGEDPIILDPQNGPGLVGANFAARASAFEKFGFFAPQFQRVKDGIGSLEDHEFQLRLSSANGRVMYIPQVLVYAHVLEERFSKSYHRRWHYGHGHFYAVMRAAGFEASRFKLFDVPGHVYRRTSSHAASWLRYALLKNRELGFKQELELRFFWGFVRKRLAERFSVLREQH